MEAGGPAGGRGGGALYAAQEPPREEEEEAKGGARQQPGAGMKFRVSARAPHGVGALLLIGGAVLAGAAVLAWRRARHPAKREERRVSGGGGVVEDGKGGTSTGRPDDKVEDGSPAQATDRPDGEVEDGSPAPEIHQPYHKVDDGSPAPEIDQSDDKVDDGSPAPEIGQPDDEVDDGSSAPEIDQPDDEVGDGSPAPEIDQPDDEVEGATSPREIDLPDDSLRVDVEKTEIGSNRLGNDGVTEEIQEVHSDAEIVADELDCERDEKFDLDSRKSATEISMHDDAESELVEKLDQSSIPKLPEVSTHDMDTVTLEKVQEDSAKKDTEHDHDSIKNDTGSDQYPITSHIVDENSSTNNLKEEHIVDENSSKNVLKEERTTNDNEDVEASDECSHGVSPRIVLNEQSIHGGGAQEAESMENSPTAQLMMHPEQLLDDMEGEAAEAKPEKETAVSDEDVTQQEQQKAMAEPDGLAGSPALPSLVKPTEKEEPEVPGRIETGMKIEQDYTNGGLKQRGMITKGRATPGGAVVTMDRRSSSVAILALMFALTIGIAIMVRLYAPPRATKLQMDLQ